MDQLKRIINIIYYTFTAFIIISTFMLQIGSSTESGILYLIIYVLIFFTSAELFSATAGIFAVTLSTSLQLIFVVVYPNFNPDNYFLLAALQVLLATYYYIIKKLKKQLFEKLTEREKYYKSLVNISLQPLILKNKKGEVVFASDSLKKNLQLKNNLQIGKDLIRYIHPQDLNKHNKFFKKVLRSPDQIKSVEFRFKRNENEWIWVKNDAVNLLKHPQINAVVSSIQDITLQKGIDQQKTDILEKEKYARELAEKAVRDRDEFLSIASHELKTPLTTILLQLQATLRKLSTQSLADFSGNDLMNALQIAEKQSQNLSSLIKDLLNVSMISSGRLTLNKERINISEVISQLIKRYKEIINLSGCQVTTTIKDKEIIAMCDPVRIEQAISNLLMNALKYAQGKKVNISVNIKDGFAQIKVKDEGGGISKELQKDIFKPFKRANGDSSIKGLGVGLFIAKQIAEAHKGTISVDSSPGKGSTFTLEIPIIQANVDSS